MEAEGATDKAESDLCRARDSSRFDIPAAPMALEVIAKWGVGRFGVEIHKGRGNSYLRFGCRACGKATPQLFDAEKFDQIFDDVFLGATGALRSSDAIGRIVSSGRGRARSCPLMPSDAR